jgi:diguanylate cyclase (GGDEF)-like protein/putative nucleotidyltransferase with HDIG domain
MLPSTAPKTRRLSIARALNDESAPATGVDFDALVAQGQEEERAGRREAARAAYERAMQQVRSTADAAQVSSVLRWIARTHHVDGNVAAARDCLDAALAMANLWHDDAAAGHAMNTQAVVCWQRGELDEAERLYLLARGRAVVACDLKLAAMTAQNLGVLANIRGDFEIAEAQYLASLAEYRSLGLTTDVCIALNNLGLLYIAQQRWAEAEASLQEGAQISALSGDLMARTQLDINLAELWVKRGEFGRAQDAVRKALDAASQTGDASAIGKATKLLGVIARETGHLTEAEIHFQHADELAIARGEVLMQAEIARERADLARRTGKNREVLQQLNRSHRLFTILRAQPDLVDVDQRVGDLEQEFLHVARRWGESIEAKDRYTQGHCQRVAELACAIARKSGLDEHALFWFRIGALLHDVGKLVIPEDVLNKPGKLDEHEWKLMRSHPTAGVEMLADIEFPWDVRPLIESHHERWDGRGYPHGLAGEQIPLIARMLSIADVYDALTSVRSYKAAHSHAVAMEILRQDIGTAFDPMVFAWFEEVAVDWPSKIAHLAEPEAVPNADTAVAVAVASEPAAKRVEAIAAAQLDDLTGVPLRRALRETTEHMLEARRTTGRPVALLVIDIDHFKVANDAYGHLHGDAVLRGVVDQIRLNLRPLDYLARYAGDEFVVLLPGTRLEDACGVGERIRAAVQSCRFTGADGVALPLTVTLSIGAAGAPVHGDTFESLFGAADNALFGAKRSGRNAVTPAARPGERQQEVLLDCFIGRTAERQRLQELAFAACDGEAHAVVVYGEAGVGKSALLRRLSPDIAVRGGAVLRGQCIEAGGGVPYGPWVDILLSAHRAGLVPPRPWRELTRLVPELTSAPMGPDRPAATAINEGASTSGLKRVLLEEIKHFLQIASTSGAIVAILDDMQWGDSASWDVLEYLLSRIDGQRLLFCLTVRPEDMNDASESRLRRLSRSERFSDITLQRFGADDVDALLRATLGGPTPPAELVRFIGARSEGNPFFAVHTLRAMVDDGSLRVDGDRWHFASGEGAPVPRAIEDLLARRLERMSRPRRDILALAAVVGRAFDPSVLAAAHEGDEASVHEALDDALAAAVLVPAGPAHATLTFSHVLLTRTLLRGVNPLRLRAMHERVARVYDAMPLRDVATIVRHYDAAGIAAEAYRTALEAGAQAQAVYAYESAANFYRIAHRHAVDAAARIACDWKLALVEELGGRLANAEGHCDDVLAYHGGSDGASDAVAVALREMAPAARRMKQRLRMQRGAAAQDVLAECEVLLTDARHEPWLEEEIALLTMLSTLHQRLGNVATAEQLACDAVTAAEQLGRPSLEADAIMRLGSVLLASNAANAVPRYRRALDIFTRIGDRYGQLRCQINIGSACDRAGSQVLAEASYLTAIEIGRDIHAVDFTGVASLNLGVLMLKTGRLAPARQRFEDALGVFVATGYEVYRLASLYNLAHVALAEHDAARALELYAASITLASTMAQADVHIGALAGAGLAELELQSWHGAQVQYEVAQALIGERTDWWFQGRELWEALGVRLMAQQQGPDAALPMLLDTLSQLEERDPYAALWLGAECAPLLRLPDPDATAALDRLRTRARAHGYAALLAQLTLPSAA